MFTVDDATADAIRRAYDDGGELSAVVEFRKHFPLFTDNIRAWNSVRAILSWTPTETPPLRAP